MRAADAPRRSAGKGKAGAPSPSGAPAVRNVTLLTCLLDGATVPRYRVPRLSETLLRELVSKNNGVGLVEDESTDAPLLADLDQLRDDATYYICPASSSALAVEVKKLRGNTDDVAEALENEAAECLRRELQRQHANVARVCHKCYVPSGTKTFELDAVVLADTCAAVAEVKTILNELSATQLLRNVGIIKCDFRACAAPRRAACASLAHACAALRACRSKLKDAPDCPAEMRMFAGKRIIPVLAGRIIKPLSSGWTAEELTEEWRAAGVVLLLPSGQGLGFQDGCFQGAPFGAD